MPRADVAAGITAATVDSGIAASPTDASGNACVHLAQILVQAAKAAGHQAAWVPSSTSGAVSVTGHDKVFRCAGYLHRSGSSVIVNPESEIQASIGVGPKNPQSSFATGCIPQSPDSAPKRQLLASLASLVNGAIQWCQNGTELLAGDGSWEVDVLYSVSNANRDQGANLVPDTDWQSVLAGWLLAIRFNGRDLPPAEMQGNGSPPPGEHLSPAKINQLIATSPCALVPVALVARSFPGSFAASSGNGSCTYAAASTKLVLIAYAARTSTSISDLKYLTTPSSRHIAVGIQGVMTRVSSTVTQIAFVDAQFSVIIEVTYPAAGTTQLVAFARQVNAILSG